MSSGTGGETTGAPVMDPSPILRSMPRTTNTPLCKTLQTRKGSGAIHGPPRS